MSDQNTPPKKDNKGYLFVNHNKNKPTQPDQTGRILIDGKEYRISAWDSATSDGRNYLSLAITPYFPPNQNSPSNFNSQNNSNNQSKNNGNNKLVNNSGLNSNGNNASNNSYGTQKNFTAAPISNDFDIDLDEILNQADDDPF